MTVSMRFPMRFSGEQSTLKSMLSPRPLHCGIFDRLMTTPPRGRCHARATTKRTAHVAMSQTGRNTTASVNQVGAYSERVRHCATSWVPPASPILSNRQVRTPVLLEHSSRMRAPQYGQRGTPSVMPLAHPERNAWHCGHRSSLIVTAPR
jgi:hypothetical protein